MVVVVVMVVGGGATLSAGPNGWFLKDSLFADVCCGRWISDGLWLNGQFLEDFLFAGVC